MSLKIKSNVDAENWYDLISFALEAGGMVLNGAKELDRNGRYIGLALGGDFQGDTFTFSDRWFNGRSQDVDTVTKAVEEATGIKLKFTSQMLSSGPATISSYEIVNQKQYDNTVGKFMQYRADLLSDLRR